MLESLYNNVTCHQNVMLTTLLKRDLNTGVPELAVRRCSTRQLFMKNSRNSQEDTCVEAYTVSGF